MEPWASNLKGDVQHKWNIVFKRKYKARRSATHADLNLKAATQGPWNDDKQSHLKSFFLSVFISLFWIIIALVR